MNFQKRLLQGRASSSVIAGPSTSKGLEHGNLILSDRCVGLREARTPPGSFRSAASPKIVAARFRLVEAGAIPSPFSLCIPEKSALSDSAVSNPGRN
jgi:hypothetical protein